MNRITTEEAIQRYTGWIDRVLEIMDGKCDGQPLVALRIMIDQDIDPFGKRLLAQANKDSDVDAMIITAAIAKLSSSLEEVLKAMTLAIGAAKHGQKVGVRLEYHDFGFKAVTYVGENAALELERSRDAGDDVLFPLGRFDDEGENTNDM